MVAEVVDVPAYVILTVLGVVMSFWGSQLARFLSSIAFASFLGYTMWIYSYSLWKSVAISALLMFVAILIGFAVGFVLFRLAVSVVFAYFIAGLIAHRGEDILFLLLFIIFTIIVYVLSKYFISLFFALAGSAMVFKGLASLSLDMRVALVVCAIVFVLGYYNQLRYKA
jgi:hypothetical protein